MGSQSPAWRPGGARAQGLEMSKTGRRRFHPCLSRNLVRPKGRCSHSPWQLPFPLASISIFHPTQLFFCTTPPLPAILSLISFPSSQSRAWAAQRGARPLERAESVPILSVAAGRRFRKCALLWHTVAFLTALLFSRSFRRARGPGSWASAKGVREFFEAL